MGDTVKFVSNKLWFCFSLSLMLFLIAGGAWAGAGSSVSLGDMASGITGSFTQIGYMITGGSYIAGVAFSIGAIMKFKQHKDNPTQIPIGTPIALLFIAIALLFLPSIFGVAGQTMFGSKGQTAGPTGTTYVN